MAYATRSNVTIMGYRAVMLKTLQRPMAIIPEIFLAEQKNGKEQNSCFRGCKITASEFRKMLTTAVVNIGSCKELRMESYCLQIITTKQEEVVCISEVSSSNLVQVSGHPEKFRGIISPSGKKVCNITLFGSQKLPNLFQFIIRQSL